MSKKSASFGSLRGPYGGIGYDAFKHEGVPPMKKMDPRLALTETETGDIMAYGADEAALLALARVLFTAKDQYTIGANPHFPKYVLDPYRRNKS